MFMRVGLLFLMSAAAVATEKPETLQSVWQGEGELGFSLTDGNTKTNNFNGKLKLLHTLPVWENTYIVEALNESQNDDTSAEKYGISAQSNKKLEGPNFLFSLMTYEKDRFSGFSYESTVSIGYGRRVLETEKTVLDLELGPGYRLSKQNLPLSSSQDEAILRLGCKYNVSLAESATFSQTLSIDSGEERVVTKSVSSISSSIVGNLAMKVSLSIKNNSEPVQISNEKTDTETSFTLVYGF